MKAIRYYEYGPPEVVKFEDVDMPVVGDDDVLVRVRASSVNPLDWHHLRGEPYLMRLGGRSGAAGRGLGADLAGEVAAVGPNVTEFQQGDEVFGSRDMSFGLAALAEYVSVRRDTALAKKPAALTFEQAAAVPVAGLTALQGLRKGGIQAGQQVLINGAAGGVGTFAVQLAKVLGAEVTGVCSTGNTGLVHSIGADHVIDYTKEDFPSGGRRYDLILDNVGNHSLSACRRALSPTGTLVLNSGAGGRWVGPLPRMAAAVVMSRFVRQKMTAFLSTSSKDDLVTLSELLDAGKITPVIDRTYPLSEAAQAIAYLEEGHAKGKVVITG
jgi:NADPH:quinone reductase-like Zn-dependent oxidoreductase